jgi:putative nucleotidyltransferase with HDIG domain
VIISYIFFIFPFFLTSLSLRIDDSVGEIFYILNKDNIYKENIVIVTIDELTLKKYQHKWPFKRTLYAKALDILKEEKTKVVGFDLVFKGEGQIEEDKKFISSLKNFKKGKVVLAYFLDKKGKPIYPKKEFKDNATLGFINTVSDADRKIRKLRSYFKTKDFFDTSWTIKICSAFKDISPQHLLERIPLNKDGTFNITYLAKEKDIETISFYDLINKNFKPYFFKEKIVLIGPTLNIVHDIHPTPLKDMAGVFIHANGILDILNKKFSRPLPFLFSIPILLFILFSVGYILFHFSFFRGFFLYLGIILLLFWFTIILKFLGWMLPYGKMLISSFIFFLMGNIYNYFSFLSLLMKIKTKITKDPLTDLFQIRYFCERVSLEQKHLPYRKKELVVILLKGIESVLKGEDFEKIKNVWRNLTSYLFVISNLWAKYGQNIIVGVKDKKYDIKRIKEEIKSILFENEIKIKVKIGILELTPNLNVRETLPFLIESLEKSEQEEKIFKKEEIPVYLPKRSKEKESIFSLYLDAEEKNRQLLSIIEKLKEEEKKTKEAYLELISSLISALESKDPYTEGHSQRVCKYALLLAGKLGLEEEEKEKIKKAALLHDLGKIGIPDRILHKKGKFTEEEFAIIKEHQVLGVKILEPIKEMKEILPYILHHHENFDGSGYPHGLAGDFIPLGARIIAVADIFDALTTGRDYKDAFTVEKTIQELKNLKGKKLDPHLVDKFIEALKEQNLL